MFGVRDMHPVSLRKRYAHVGRRRANPGLNFLEAVAVGLIVVYAAFATAS
jgi:hypothetical protein